ncbi:MAG: glycerol-phosphate dehydrogenase [Methanohalophilus sp.]|nr:glycerol-phosphate dehydrogenase [Methanohalophilus sp.]
MMEIVKDNKWMQLPRDILVGSGVINKVDEVCQDLLLGDHGLIITGKKTAAIAGKPVQEMLEDSGKNIDIFIAKRASMEEIERAMEVVNQDHIGFLMGVGSGSSIDVAKLAATNLDVPFLSIPTAASHDGIVSSRASIIKDGDSVSIQANAPMAVIADTEIIAKAPYRLLAAGCGDIISNCTAVLDWELAHRLQNVAFSEYAAALSRMTANILIDSADSIKPKLESSVRMVVKALVSSGVAMSIAGSSRPASGSEHMFSHALNKIAPNPALHGEQCGVGTILMMYLHGGDWKKIKHALETINAPTTAKALGIEDKYILEALVQCHKIRPERYTILGTGITRDAAEIVAKTTGVIS